MSPQLTLHFASSAAQLTPDHKVQLRDALRHMRPGGVVISGRTDATGSTRVNQALALARSLAVRDHLLDLDPNLAARIAIDARGRCCYAAANDSASGRAQNRRVDLTYLAADREAP